MTLRQKVDALVFLTSNTIHLLLVLLLLCQFLLLIWPSPWSYQLEFVQALLIAGLCLPTLISGAAAGVRCRSISCCSAASPS